ncbi:MAG: CHASE2 domain-containing protein, partial [Gammaproteobacteria bacterium]|nr:CHASE2 domain-containing protein [Gammaproteobacteria bacterium]
MKTRFWSSDWFAGLLISIVVIVMTLAGSFEALERSFYDWGVRSTERLPSDKIAIIAIDDESIANFESWPWPRDLHAALIDQLTEGGAKVIGQTVFFVDPQRQAGIDYIRGLIDFFSNASFEDVPPDVDALGAMLEFEGNNKAVKEILEFYLESSINTRLGRDIETLKARLFEAEQALNSDAILAQSIKQSQNVVLASIFVEGIPRGNPDAELPDYMLRNSLSEIRDRVSAQDQGLFPISTIDALPPIPQLGAHAAAIGHLNSKPDFDGSVRWEPMELQ